MIKVHVNSPMVNRQIKSLSILEQTGLLLSLPEGIMSLAWAYIYHYHHLIKMKKSFKCPHPHLSFRTSSSITATVNHFSPSKMCIKTVTSIFSIGTTAEGSDSFLCIEIWDIKKKNFHKLLLISLSVLKSLSWRGCALLLRLQIRLKSSDKQGTKSITVLHINCSFKKFLNKTAVLFNVIIFKILILFVKTNIISILVS